MDPHGCHTFVTLTCQHAGCPALNYLLPNLGSHVVESYTWNLTRSYVRALAAKKAVEEAVESKLQIPQI